MRYFFTCSKENQAFVFEKKMLVQANNEMDLY